MDDDVTLSARLDKFLREAALTDGEKTAIRAQIAAADAAVVAANTAAISAASGTLGTLGATVAGHTAAIATADGDIDALQAAVAANTDAIENLDDTLSAQVVGVASVAGQVGVITKPELLAAINVTDGADITNPTTVAAAAAASAVKAVPVDDDEVVGRDSAAAGALRRFTIASIVTKAQALFDTLYASIAQGVKADTALQPSTAVTLSRIQMTPVALASLPTAAEAGAGTTANINNGNVATLGAVAASGGALVQRVRSNGTDWIVDSGAAGGGVTDHGALAGLGDDDHAQYLRVDGTRDGTGMQKLLGVSFAEPSTITVVMGAATATQTLHFLTLSTGTVGSLHTLAAAKGVGDLVIVTAFTGRTITILSGTGNILTFNGGNLTVTSTSPTLLIRMGDYWFCLQNGAAASGGTPLPVADSTALVSDGAKLVGLDAGAVTSGQTRRIQSPDGDSRVRDVLSWIFADVATTGTTYNGIVLPAGFYVESIRVSVGGIHLTDAGVWFTLKSQGVAVGASIPVGTPVGLATNIAYGTLADVNVPLTSGQFLQVTCDDDGAGSTGSPVVDCVIHVVGHWRHE
jgi:hypothetical protein